MVACYLLILSAPVYASRQYTTLLWTDSLGSGSSCHGFSCPLALCELAIFAVDFAPQSTRCRLNPRAPPCGAAASFRGRSPLGSADDQAERARIHAEILALGTSLRPASPS